MSTLSAGLLLQCIAAWCTIVLLRCQVLLHSEASKPDALYSMAAKAAGVDRSVINNFMFLRPLSRHSGLYCEAGLPDEYGVSRKMRPSLSKT